jgi:putative membrane protein
VAGETSSLTLFTGEDRLRIERAIAEAEARTSGEIVAVVAHQSDGYRYIALLWASLTALLVPWPLVALTEWTVQEIYLAQLVVFAALALLFQWTPLRLALVPGPVKRARAHRRAVEQFLAQNLHTTAGRTGVLIFVSVAEHYAELIADRAVDAKAPDGAWRTIVDELTAKIGEGRAADGFVAAVAACGAILAEHFPPDSADRNELPNHLIVL